MPKTFGKFAGAKFINACRIVELFKGGWGNNKCDKEQKGDASSGNLSLDSIIKNGWQTKALFLICVLYYDLRLI